MGINAWRTALNTPAAGPHTPCRGSRSLPWFAWGQSQEGEVLRTQSRRHSVPSVRHVLCTASRLKHCAMHAGPRSTPAGEGCHSPCGVLFPAGPACIRTFIVSSGCTVLCDAARAMAPARMSCAGLSSLSAGLLAPAGLSGAPPRLGCDDDERDEDKDACFPDREGSALACGTVKRAQPWLWSVFAAA